MHLETKRLKLRECTVSDITDSYVAALNNPRIVQYTEARHTSWNRANAEQYVRDSNRLPETMLIGIFLQESGKHIGNIRLFNIHPVHKRAELGIMLFDASEWGKGYGTEAIGAVVSFAFDTLDLHRIQADYYATNSASASLFKKTGFDIEGIFKDHFLTPDGFVDSIRIAKVRSAP